jgi:hypothetical protein
VVGGKLCGGYGQRFWQGLLSLGSPGDSELEASPITKNLRLVVEVGSMVDLSCDGQEGMQVDCLK